MSTLPSGLPEEIDDNEDIVRFITASKQFSKDKMIAKVSALFPPDANGEKSVFRHGKQPESSLWALSFCLPKVYGAVFFKAATVRKAMIKFVAKEPPPKHANMVDWPMDKAEKREAALTIIQQS